MEPVVNKSPTDRLASIDAYRGLVMFLMMAEALELKHVARALPQSSLWAFLKYHQSHVEWAGCSLHDLIQPSFSFLVGVALPFSLASRLAKGHSFGHMTLHALWRALLLILLGVFLRSIGKPQTNFTFEDTLSQIGLGYVPLFLLGFTRQRWHWAALVMVLVGYWGLFAFYPAPTCQQFYSLETVGVPPDWPHHYPLDTFAAHWNKNSNPAWAFDRWFLNQFPRSAPFLFNGGGYATLSFIPTLGTMILGLICGTWLLRAKLPVVSAEVAIRQPFLPERAMGYMLAAAAGCFAIALAVDLLGLGPNVKRIWTPTWVLFSGGWCFLFMTAFYGALDVAGWRKAAYPLVVIGANSIAAYMLSHLIDGFTREALRTHLGAEAFQVFGPAYEPLLLGAGVLLVYWLILWWMYRRRLFLKI